MSEYGEPIDPALAARARHLSWLYNLGTQVESLDDLGGDEEGSGPFTGDLGYVEHTIHELAHASLLTLEFGSDLSKNIADALSDLGEAIAENHEMMAWVVEWEVMQLLGVPTFTWCDCVAGAEVQGCDLRLLEQEKGAAWAMPHAKKIAQHLKETHE